MLNTGPVFFSNANPTRSPKLNLKAKTDVAQCFVSSYISTGPQAKSIVLYEGIFWLVL